MSTGRPIPIRPGAVLLSGGFYLRTAAAAAAAAAAIALIPTAAECDDDDRGDDLDNSPEGVQARNPLWPGSMLFPTAALCQPCIFAFVPLCVNG